MHWLTKLDELHPLIKLLLGFSLIGLLGLGDYLTGSTFAFAIFYLVPIVFLTRSFGRRLGIMAAVVSLLVTLGADAATGPVLAQPLILVWNSLTTLAFFTIIIILLVALNRAYTRTQELIRTDSLTSAVNSRVFFELLQLEIERSHRYTHPFTLVYLDLDNFKTVNDQYGHAVGDQVLQAVVSCAKTRLRKIDVVARLGGDEFALLLPETGPEAAPIALGKFQSGLVAALQQNQWPLTLSIGVVTCRAAGHATADELVRMVENLTQAVKRENKNAVKYTTYPS